MLAEIKSLINEVKNGKKTIEIAGHSAEVSALEIKFMHSYTVVCTVTKKPFGNVVTYNNGGFDNKDMEQTIASYKEVFGE